jgi:hypothetical protein
MDFVTFGPQATDVSEGRFPDASASIYGLTTPTPRAANFLATSNTAPVVGSIADLVVMESQLLLVNATAMDAEAPPQTLIFSLDPGVPAGATINSANGLFSWRPAAAETPSTNLITVRVTDDGAPPMSGTTTFTVRVTPRPQVTGVAPLANGDYAITFVTVPGKTYRVEFKNALEESNWQQLDADVVATGESLTVNDNLAANSQRFYRILVLD